MYEPITVEIDRGYSEGNYRSYSINFIGRVVRIVEDSHTMMRLYEWADLGRLLYLVHVEEHKAGRFPAAPSIRSSTPTPPVAPRARDTPERRFLELIQNSPLGSFWDFPGIRPNEVGAAPELGSDFGWPPSAPIIKDRDLLPLLLITQLHIYTAPQHLVSTPTPRCRAIGRFWPYRTGECRILQANFGESPFLGRTVNKGRRIGFGDVWGGFEGDREHRWAQ